MRYSVDHYRDPVDKKRRGFILTRLDNGQLYFSAFATRPAAEEFATRGPGLHPRFWRDRVSDVTFALHSSLRESLEAGSLL